MVRCALAVLRLPTAYCTNRENRLFRHATYSAFSKSCTPINRAASPKRRSSVASGSFSRYASPQDMLSHKRKGP